MKIDCDNDNLPMKDQQEPRTVDSIIESYSFRKIVILLLFAISMGILADGIEMTLMALFLLPIKSYYKLTKFELEAISSLLFLGVALGSYLVGFLSNHFGRSKTINYNYGLFFVSHILLSFSFHHYMFGFARFMIGVSLGVIIPLSLNLMSEFLSNKYRAVVLTGIWIFFSLGQGIEAIVMLYGMPNFEVGNMKYILAFLSIFILLSWVLNYFYFVDSPRNLLSNKQYDEAFELLNKMIKEPLSKEEKDSIKNNAETLNNSSKDKEYPSVDELFTEELYPVTLIQITIMFILSFLFYGIFLISTLTMQKLNIVNHEGTFEEIIKNQIIVAFSSMPGGLLGGIMAEMPFFGRKGTIWISFLISSSCCFGMIFMNHYTLFLSIYLFFVTIAFNVFLTYTVEIYPTRLRDTSSGFLFGCLRIAGFFSQFLYLALHQVHYLFPYYFTGFISLAAVYIVIKLPYEPLNQCLDHDYKQVHVEDK